MILIYITCKNTKEAKKISKHLLEKKLIACANMHQIDSTYLWQGKIEESKETVIIAKTKEKNYNKIKKEIKKIHSYKIPCILKIKAKPNQKYNKWINDELK